MGTLSKHKTTCLTERDIQNILSIHFLTPNAKKYEMENLFVFGWESDYLCITKSDLIYECEIKIFRSDFQNDFKHKKKKHLLLESKDDETSTDNKKPDYFYYAVPEGLITKDEVPEYAGLIYVSKASGSNNVFSTCTVVKQAPRLKKEKTDLDSLNLMNKFYYSYRQWKGSSLERDRQIVMMTEDYNALLEKQGVATTFKGLNDEIERLKIELDETESLAKAMSRRAEEASKRIVHLERLLRKNNIEFDRYGTEK